MSYEDSRYGHLLEIIEEKKPVNIMEIGTSNGRSALAMMTKAKSVQPEGKGVTYWGFDLFEAATEETDKEEFNVKPAANKEAVREVLEDYETLLFGGNTREVLKNFVNSNRPTMGLVFIDGGHSIETIESDWGFVQKCVKPGSVVVFDDYYVPEKKGFGCNTIVEKIEGHVVLPREDYVVGGGAVRMVRVDI